MEPFRALDGLVALLDLPNVDTDQIIPKQFLKRIERTGFGQYLFFDWRFLPDGSPNPEFELNQPANSDASILIARRNFGSGSSREHAVWALDDYGFRAVIAPTFADIFYNNCFKNGLLPIALTEEQVEEIFKRYASYPQYTLTVDLEKCQVTDSFGMCCTFSIEPYRRHCMLHGLDDIALTLEHVDKIDAYEKAHAIA